MRLPRLTVAASAAALMALAAACAREGAPPGGPVDRRPPVLVKTVPDTFAVVRHFKGPVRFTFDERISEKLGSGVQDFDHAVMVSPHTGNVRVDHNRDGVSVTIGGGFKPNLVYRVTLLPVLRDLFGNQILAPIDLVFSTGAPFDTTALAGMVWDRITGEGLADAMVHAVSDSDSLVYESETDSGGVYAFRYLPSGRYSLIAFQDQNRNGRPDFSEYQGRAKALIGVHDTLFIDVPALRPDTTPARVTGDTAVDSVTVAVRFDDYLDPNAPLSRVGVKILRADSTPGPGVRRVFYESQYQDYVDQLKDSFARMDSIAKVEAAKRKAAGDTTPPAAAPKRALPPPLPVMLGGGGVARGRGRQVPFPGGAARPGRRLVVLLDTPLVSGKGYVVDVSGVVNINGVPLGGGSSALVFTRPDTTKADTTKADTTKADTTKADTTKADTTGVDTTKAGTIKADTMKAGGAAADTAKSDSTKARAAKTDTTHADTTHLRPVPGADPGRLRRPG